MRRSTSKLSAVSVGVEGDVNWVCIRANSSVPYRTHIVSSNVASLIPTTLVGTTRSLNQSRLTLDGRRKRLPALGDHGPYFRSLLRLGGTGLSRSGTFVVSRIRTCLPHGPYQTAVKTTSTLCKRGRGALIFGIKLVSSRTLSSPNLCAETCPSVLGSTCRSFLHPARRF